MAASSDPRIATGMTIAFGTSSWAGKVTSISRSGVARESRQTSHLGTSTWHTHVIGKLTEPGTCEIDVLYSPNDPPPSATAAETITITFPLGTGESGAATEVFSGAVIGFDWTGAMEELYTGTITVKVLGAPTYTDAT